MRILQVFVALSFALFATALPQVKKSEVAARYLAVQQDVTDEQRVVIEDFLIDGLTTSSILIRGTNSMNNTISFQFNDPNSKTSKPCKYSWLKSNTTDNTPSGPDYVVCSPTSGKEFFIWRFTSFTSVQQFGLQVAHGFNDPVHYPPPYSAVEYFATIPKIGMDCPTLSTTKLRCQLPKTKSPLHGVVNQISN